MFEFSKSKLSLSVLSLGARSVHGDDRKSARAKERGVGGSLGWKKGPSFPRISPSLARFFDLLQKQGAVSTDREPGNGLKVSTNLCNIVLKPLKQP